MPEQKPPQKTCFVIGPIGGDGTPARTHADWLYEGIVLPTFRAHFEEWKVTRSDKISSPGMIDSQMINLLIQADLVIADMSLLNANAFYEMGIRHMAQKPIIHMFIAGSEIPFDVKPYRAIPFSLTDYRNLESAQLELKAAVSEAVAPDHVVENPVTRAFGKAEFARTASEPEKIIEGEMQDLKERLGYIEQNYVRISREGASAKFISPSIGRDYPPANADGLNYSATIMIRISTSSIGSDEFIKTLTNTILNKYVYPRFDVYKTSYDDDIITVGVTSMAPISNDAISAIAKDIRKLPYVLLVEWLPG